MKAEASLWDHLRGLLPPDIHYSRIESETSPGFPDIYYTLEGVTGTIELKSVDRPKAKYPFSEGYGLRKSQYDWIEAEESAGGFVLLCLEIKPYVFVLQASLCYDELHRMTSEDIRRVAEIAWKRGFNPADLSHVLMNKP